MMGDPPEVIQKFRKLVAGGMGPGLASIIASRKCPRLETATSDAVNLKPERNNAGIGFKRMQEKRARAKAAGIPVTDDSFYNGSIADERGELDPDAWVHPGEGRDKLRRAVRKKGGSSEDLGVEPGEDHERFDRRQKEVEQQTEINQKRLKLKKQLKRDGITDVGV
jgi:hypothetical protein